MKRKLKTLQVFLFIAGFFFIVGFSAFFYCCNLAKLDFRFQDLSLENPEEDNTGINYVYALKISRLNSCLDVLFLIRDIPKQSSLIDFLKPCLDQKRSRFVVEKTFLPFNSACFHLSHPFLPIHRQLI